MKKIIKNLEPRSLVQHRTQPYASYDNLPIGLKDELRNNLLKEQGYICCYCMKRIYELSDHMKIEHFKCQENYKNLQLTYSNLLGACKGNEGQQKHLQTCDTRKGKNDLTINPLSNNPNCETLFKYNANGEIFSINGDDEIEQQISEVLNLNMQMLKENRKQVFIAVQEKVESESRKLTTRSLKKRYFEYERDKWLTKDGTGKFKEYCMVAVYYLNKKIKANS